MAEPLNLRLSRKFCSPLCFALRFELPSACPVELPLAFQAFLLGSVGRHHVLGFQSLEQGIHTLALVHSDLSHSCAPECREMCSATQRLANVSCQRPDVGALAAHHPDDDGGLLRQVAFQQLYLVDDESLGSYLHLLAFSRKFVGRLTVNFASRESRWHLLDGSGELLLQRLLHQFSRDVLPGIGGIDLRLEVEGWCGLAQLDVGDVFLHSSLQLLYDLCGTTGADGEHSRGERVERASMTHSQRLDVESLAQSCPHFLDNLKGSPLQGFVDVEYFAVYGIQLFKCKVLSVK